MRAWLWCGLGALLAAACACAAPTYTTTYDDVDLDEILANERLLSGYIKCLMEEGPCTADARELRNNLPDAIADGCSRCSEKQRDGSAKVMHYIIDHRPTDWTRLETIYDAEGSYRKLYLENKQSSQEKSADGSPEEVNKVDSEITTEKV